MCIQIAGICQTILCSPAVTDSFGPLLPPPIFCQNEYEHSAAHQGVYYACAREKERVYVVTLKQQPLFFCTHTQIHGLKQLSVVWRGCTVYLPSSSQLPCWAQHSHLTVFDCQATTLRIWKPSTTGGKRGLRATKTDRDIKRQILSIHHRPFEDMA